MSSWIASVNKTIRNLLALGSDLETPKSLGPGNTCTKKDVIGSNDKLRDT